MGKHLVVISFYNRFEHDIKSGKKTITIRDKVDQNISVGKTLKALRHEDGSEFAQLLIQSIKPITLNQLNQDHARGENMSLEELKTLIQQIYPHQKQFYIISFKVVSQ